MLVLRIIASLFIALLPTLSEAHTDDSITIYSTAPGGGSLVASGGPDEAIHAPLIVCGGGSCLYENDEGAIRTPAIDDAVSGLYALSSGTTVRVEIVAVDTGVAINIGGKNLDQPGDSVELGKATGIHAHPIWRIEAPPGTNGTSRLSFRFRTTDGPYSDSLPFELELTNHEGHEQTTTTLSSMSTTTSTSSTSTALVELQCGDPDGDGETKASDALFILAVAVGTQECPSCVCNVDSSIAPLVSGADALRVLLYAVGLANDPLVCPACSAG